MFHNNHRQTHPRMKLLFAYRAPAVIESLWMKGSTLNLAYKCSSVGTEMKVMYTAEAVISI